MRDWILADKECLHLHFASSRLLTSRFVALVSENIGDVRVEG